MKHLRTIKSFIKRQRKLPPTKQKIYDELWPKYGLEGSDPNFGSNPVTLEIGFGNGENLFHIAKNHPEQNFIGIEVHVPGIANLFALLKNQPLDNIKIYNDDAVEVLKKHIPDNSLDKILILYPDPWPKKPHHKRRLIQPEFIKLLRIKLKPKGMLNIATDWENYAEHIIKVLENSPGFSKLKSIDDLPKRNPTKFETRGKDKGHKNFDFYFKIGSYLLNSIKK